MDEERSVSSRENPRFLGGLGNGNNNGGNKAVTGEVAKAVPSILDRFRALMKGREEEIMVSGEDEVPLPRPEDIVGIYKLVLGELTFNSKPIITDLTIIAGEQREHGEGIADAICLRILEVPVEQKLPSFYLLDSIVKNIGREYVRYFSARLPEVFYEAYRQVHPNLHPAMRHLFGTWLTVFSPSVLHKIEAQLRFSPLENHQSSALKASESPRPTHGIHVNPKYLEARRQIGHSTPDDSVRGSSSKITGLHDDLSQFVGSRYPQEDFPHYIAQSSRHPLSSEGGGANFQMLPSSSANQKPLINSFPNADAQLRVSSAIASRMGAESIDSWKSESLATAVPPLTGAWPPINIQKTHPFPVLPPLPQQKKSKSQFDPMNASNTVMNQGLNKSFLPEHQFDSIENKALSSIKLPSFPNQQALAVPLNPLNREQVTPTQPQLLSQEVRRNLVPARAIPAVVSMPSLIPPLAHGYIPQGHHTATSNVNSNPIPGVHPSMPFLNMPSSSTHLHGAGFPPLPQGPLPDSSHMIPISHNRGSIAPNPQGGGALSGLIGSLVAHGLISLTNQSPVQESVGLEFNPDVLKLRHESAITALYADLPRQCTTCGLRFKCQEEHSSHMDWHVTKNRISKTRKQKPSRKWFVSVNMWLTGAEALGTESVPGFLPAESDVEKKDDEEFAVPADENQNVCALCGEPFDDFYSDETEEWMYRGAVYMNAPSGSAAGWDRSQLGPIVHAKCRSESSVVSPEVFGQDEGGYTEEGSQWKRLRT